ncbi:MAG: HAMP domain-containing histidine kinase, partial [Deltaproteobacteria bacterium]
EFLLRSPQIGFLIEGVLLSLGLAYRINLLETAKIKAEKEAIDNRIYKDLSKLSNQVSHDLQSPLAALHVLGKDQNLSMDFKSMLQSTIDRITSIVSDLKIKSPEISNEIYEPTNLNKVVDEIIHEKSLEFSNRPDVKIKVSLPFFTLTYSINRSSFHRILSNVINNAIEAKSSTRDVIEVSVQLQKSEETFRLLITDNGVGIKPELREEIFREGSSFGKEDGHGLGLYHAHKTLSKMGLNIRILESNESGTVFEITPDKSHKNQ